MDTPICDFVRRYRQSGALRLHMPGHKGVGPIGPEALDITEIRGADELFHARGVIRQSEENAAALFGAGRTLYSTEGSSLCVRAMLYLALLRAREQGLPPVLLAGRNAHRSLLSAAALLEIDVAWLWGDSLLSCPLGGRLEAALDALPAPPMAVYVTAPDYLGNLEDIASLAAACHARGVPLLVDNAHGAYLRFLPEDRHPLTLGADLCCDSAHKTLPCLTGAAYLHVGKGAPALFFDQAERAMALFASTSPSYLILQSLDAANRALAEAYRGQLAGFLPRLDALKRRLAARGWALCGREPMKLALRPKPFGYTGDALHDLLRAQGIEGEFSDPDHLVLMPAPATGEAGLARLEKALDAVPRRAPVVGEPPAPPRPRRATSLRQALLSPQREVPSEAALGCVLADAHVACPPAVAVAVGGEIVDADVLRCLRYYGVERCQVVAEGKG